MTDQRAPLDREAALEWAREITARFFENDPLDRGRKEIAAHTREGRYDDQDAVQIALSARAAILSVLPSREEGVIQADRDAGAEFAWTDGDVGTSQLRFSIRSGKLDNHGAVQAFRRHRLAFAVTRAPDVSEERESEMTGPPWHFERFVGGIRMAEGIKISNASTFEEARDKAAKLAPDAAETVLVASAMLAFAAQPATVPEGELRPEVVAFAHLMERQLRANDHKPGWKGDTPGALWRRLMQEARELSDETNGYAAGTIDPVKAGQEAADVANFAMMIADVCGALPAAQPEPVALQGVGEALTLARPIVEADLHAAIDHADADWEGISRTALEAIDAALLTPSPKQEG